MAEQQKRLRIHVVSETAFVMKGQGVHTAFVDCVDLLKSRDDVDVVVNNEGWGDVMHAHTYGPYYFWKGRRYGGRRIFTVHVIPDSARGSLPAWKLLMPLVRWYLRRVYSYADACIAISPAVEDAVHELGVKTRIVRIPNPVHVDKFAPTPERRAAGRRLLGLPENAFVVLGAGQLEGRKGVEDFLDVAAACPELSFVWVGGRPFGVMTEGIRRLNRRIAAVGNNVRFPGLFPLEQMPLICNAADLLLFPSYQENCPLVPLEAAAAGLPVVYRDIREYACLYENPYIKATDTAGFILLTRRIATDPGFREHCRSVSRKLLTQFDMDEIRQRLLTLYGEVWAGPIDERRSRPLSSRS
jgi:1,2-diacylglycerol-3-alpha-glucose alpha-1,2-galactosyltransferase